MENDKVQFFVSDAAIAQIKLQLEKRGTPDARLRLGIKGSGCSGYSYVFQFEDAEPRDKDHILHFSGISLVIDKKSMIYLNGASLNWESTLAYQGFKFDNPNVKSRCGCGSSFSV